MNIVGKNFYSRLYSDTFQEDIDTAKKQNIGYSDASLPLGDRPDDQNTGPFSELPLLAAHEEDVIQAQLEALSLLSEKQEGGHSDEEPVEETFRRDIGTNTVPAKRQNTAQVDDSLLLTDSAAQPNADSHKSTPFLALCEEAAKKAEREARTVISGIQEEGDAEREPFDGIFPEDFRNYTGPAKRQNTAEVDDSLLMMDSSADKDDTPLNELPVLSQFDKEVRKEEGVRKLWISETKGSNREIHRRVFAALQSGTYDNFDGLFWEINCKNEDGKTPLALAAIGGSVPLIQRLLTLCADISLLSLEDFYYFMTLITPELFACHFPAIRAYIEGAKDNYNSSTEARYFHQCNTIFYTMGRSAPVVQRLLELRTDMSYLRLRDFYHFLAKITPCIFTNLAAPIHQYIKNAEVTCKNHQDRHYYNACNEIFEQMSIYIE